MLRVEVEWLDSGKFFKGDGWENKDTISGQKVGNVITVGHLIMEDSDGLYVGLSYDPENDHFYGTQIIWKPSVKRLTVLRARRNIGPDKEGNYSAAAEDA